MTSSQGDGDVGEGKGGKRLKKKDDAGRKGKGSGQADEDEVVVDYGFTYDIIDTTTRTQPQRGSGQDRESETTRMEADDHDHRTGKSVDEAGKAEEDEGMEFRLFFAGPSASTTTTTTADPKQGTTSIPHSQKLSGIQKIRLESPTPQTNADGEIGGFVNPHRPRQDYYFTFEDSMDVRGKRKHEYEDVAIAGGDVLGEARRGGWVCLYLVSTTSVLLHIALTWF